MKRFSICVLAFVVFVAASSMALATSVPVSTESSQSTLTVVFDAPPEFATQGSVSFAPVSMQVPQDGFEESVITANAPEINISGDELISENDPVVTSKPATLPKVIESSSSGAVPEPSTFILLGLGVLGILGLARRKKA